MSRRVLARCERRHVLADESEDVLGTPHAYLSLPGTGEGDRVFAALRSQRLDTLDPGGSTLLRCPSCRRHYAIENAALLAVAADKHARTLNLQSTPVN